MITILKIVNTLFLIYLFANDKTRTEIIINIKKLGCFLMREIDDGFKRQDEFLEFLVKGHKEEEKMEEVVREEEVSSSEAKEQEIREVVVKVEEKFEDKYLQKFKAFKNEYSFTENELKIEQEKYEELKTVFTNNKAKEIEDITLKITKLQRILNCVTFDENGKMIDVSENGTRLLTRYYDIEEEYEDNPDNYMLSDLFGELSEILTETQQKLKEQEDQIVSDSDFKEQAYQYMLKNKLDGYINNYINEMTPLGNVYMRYNNSKKSFEYYSNNTIPYRYLEPVGRKFVLTYFCKPLFIDIEDELKKAQVKKDDKKAEEKDRKENDKNGNDRKDVFAKMKSYNNTTQEMSKMGKQNVLPPQIKANLPNVNTSSGADDMLLKENSNRYTWEGRLANMNLLKKVDRKTVDKTYAMSFAEFKRLRQQQIN